MEEAGEGEGYTVEGTPGTCTEVCIHSRSEDEELSRSRYGQSRVISRVKKTYMKDFKAGDSVT